MILDSWKLWKQQNVRTSNGIFLLRGFKFACYNIVRKICSKGWKIETPNSLAKVLTWAWKLACQMSQAPHHPWNSSWDPTSQDVGPALKRICHQTSNCDWYTGYIWNQILAILRSNPASPLLVPLQGPWLLQPGRISAPKSLPSLTCNTREISLIMVRIDLHKFV